MFTGRAAATATLLRDGRVLVATGSTSDPERAELYDPGSDKFVRTGTVMTFSQGGATATLIPDGKVLVIGATDVPRAELYDPANGKFTPTSFAPGAAGSAKYNGKAFERTAPQTATLLRDGRVLLFETGYLETYDPSNGLLVPCGFLSPPGDWFGPTSTLLADGRVLIAGGYLESDANGEVVDATAAIYGPATRIDVIGPMHTPRGDHTATLLPDGSVLIAGGTSGGENALSSAELFVP
jgi:hypothetical protein